MDLRLFEITAPADAHEAIKAALDRRTTLRRWEYLNGGETNITRLLLHANEVESLFDDLALIISAHEGMQILILPVEAAIPRLEEPKPDAVDEDESISSPLIHEPRKTKKPASRISREELHADISGAIQTLPIFLILAGLSTIVAAIGLIRNSVALLIAAMVIAPLLGPNVALALATTLADLQLGLRALRQNLIGVVLALLLSLSLGMVLNVDPTTPEIAARTVVGLGDIVLALAAGIAGVLAFTSGAPSALIGVMVAVALVPPLAVVGLLTGSGHFNEAMGAALLLATNVIGLNLAAVATFLIQGVRPHTWWEAGRARKASRIAITLWLVLLAALITVITVSNK